MSLQVWLPLYNTNITNYGLSDLEFPTPSTRPSIALGGKFGSGLSNNGAAIDINSTTEIDLGLQQSLFCWVNMTAFNNNPIGLCGNHCYHQNLNLGLNFKRSSDTAAYLSISTGHKNRRTWSEYSSASLVSAGVWTHVGYTYDGTDLKLYINGQLDKTYTVTDIQTGPAIFEVWRWAVDHTGYYLNGIIADVRAYDHTLSTKEVHELAKAKFIHYPFDKGDYNTNTNILNAMTPGAAMNVAWDATLHPNAIKMDGWSQGYNGGVSSASSGYHAHWIMMNDIPTMVFPKLNHTISGISATRWLGISESNVNHSSQIQPGTTYTISFEAMADSPGREIYCGMYAYSISAGKAGFPDGYCYAKNIPIGTWKKYSFTVTASTTDYDPSKAAALFYFYGHSGSNGIAYVRNPRVEIGAYAHDDCIGESDLTVYNVAGGLRHGTVNGNVTIRNAYATSKSNTESYADKNYNYAYFDGASYVKTSAVIIPDCYTMACWINRHSYGHAVDWRDASGVGVQPLYIRNDGCIQAYSSSGGSNNSQYFTTPIPADTWCHVAMVATATTLTYYLNGVRQETYAITNAEGSLANLHIGCRCDSTSNKINMDMRDFRIYSTALSDADIIQLYQIPFSIDKSQNVFAKTLREGL